MSEKLQESVPSIYDGLKIVRLPILVPKRLLILEQGRVNELEFMLVLLLMFAFLVSIKVGNLITNP